MCSVARVGSHSASGNGGHGLGLSIVLYLYNIPLGVQHLVCDLEQHSGHIVGIGASTQESRVQVSKVIVRR
jgi:hypothetical protein